jgi:integrase
MRFKEHALNEYRRHAPDCKLTKPSEMSCNCPLWAVGRVRGERFRKSLSTRSRQKARERIAELLEQKQSDASFEDPARAPLSIEKAISDYLVFCEKNKRLRVSTLKCYRNTFKTFLEFCGRRLYSRVDQLNLDLFEQYQVERVSAAPRTAKKEFQHLSTLANRLTELGIIPVNFVRKVKLAKVDDVATWPLKQEEARAILTACGRLGEMEHRHGGYASYTADEIDEERRYAKALVLTLLATGLRIGDVVNLRRSNVYTDRQGAVRLKLRTEKTRVVVTLLLPNATVQALKNIPQVSDELFFWKGGDERQYNSAVARARRIIKRLGHLVGLDDVHPHRFRDTFAVTALLNSTPMHTLQKILGHKSIRTTELHYAPFTSEFQARIDDATLAVANRLIA